MAAASQAPVSASTSGDKRLGDAGVIAVEPAISSAVSSCGTISRRSIGASVSVSKALSGFSAPATGGPSDHQHQVLDADAVGAGLVVAGLVREDHAALERGGAELGDARRALVHRQIAADAVAGAVVEIERRPPTANWRAKESSCAPVVPSGNTARAIAIWPLSTRVKRSRISAVGSPTADGAGDVGGAVLVLGAGVDQEQLAGAIARLVLRVTR